MSLVERGGDIRSTMLDHRSAMGIVRQHVHKDSRLVTDSAAHYKFPPVASHEFVDHSKFEWSRGDVHTFAIDVAAFDDHIAKIDADAIANALCFGALRFGPRRRLLDRECAVDGRDNAPEFDECAVTHELDHAPGMGSDAGIEDPTSVDLQPFERPGVVGLHKAAVTDHVGRQDRG